MHVAGSQEFTIEVKNFKQKVTLGRRFVNVWIGFVSGQRVQNSKFNVNNFRPALHQGWLQIRPRPEADFNDLHPRLWVGGVKRTSDSFHGKWEAIILSAEETQPGARDTAASTRKAFRSSTQKDVSPPDNFRRVSLFFPDLFYVERKVDFLILKAILKLKYYIYVVICDLQARVELQENNALRFNILLNQQVFNFVVLSSLLSCCCCWKLEFAPCGVLMYQYILQNHI